MKLRRLFFALLALPLAFVACEPEPAPTPEPEPEPAPEKTIVLDLKSELTLEFEAEGGKGVIKYELVEQTRNLPEVEATCEAKWITDLTVAEDITFNVAANEGEARDTKVVVTYGEQKFEVAVNQAAKGAEPEPEPEPEPEYVMNVKLAAAARIPSAELEIADNMFALAFVDDAENVELGIVVTGAASDVVLQAGNYATDVAELYVYEPEAEYEFVSGNVVVELAEEVYSFDITLKDDENKLYHFTYQGVVLDMEPAEKPEPKTFVPVYVEAYRAQTWDLGNFELDLYINDELYHSLDMQDMINPNDGHLTAGVYTMDDGSITTWSNFMWDLETGEGAYMTDAEITITHFEDGTTNLKGYFESEYGDHLDIDWTGVVAGFVFGGATPEPPVGGEDIAFTAPYFVYEYYSAADMGTPGNNYWVILSDDSGLNPNDRVPGATYMVFDLYSAVEQDSLPLGTYTLDVNDSGKANTMGYYYSYGLVVNEAGEPKAWYSFSEGTVTVTEGKIYAELTCEDTGDKVTVTYEGDLSFAGGSELEGGIELNVSGAGVHSYYYGDMYGVGADLWWVEIYEDDANKSGKYLQFELLVNPAYDDWRGSFTALTDESTSYYATFVPGYLSDNYLSGAWYAELEDGYISDVYTPLVGGNVEFVYNENGSITVLLDCVDDLGNKITGTVSGNPAATTYAKKSTKNIRKISLKQGISER